MVRWLYIFLFTALNGLPVFPLHASEKSESSLPADSIIRCLTPHLLHYEEDPMQVSPSIRNKIQKIREPIPFAIYTYTSPSGKFRIEYRTQGPNAVPSDDETQSGVPDYVEWTARYADESYRKQVEEMGFIDPTRHQGFECGNRRGSWQDTVITIRYHSSRYYGSFNPRFPFEFVVHKDFRGFPPNTNPEGQIKGALKVTIAHELKHVIQYATNCMQGDAGNTSWLEMDATMMENVVYPEVNDYYNYIVEQNSIFNNPEYRIPAVNFIHSYSHVTWPLFFAESSGIGFWVDTWDKIHRNPLIPMVDAMKSALPSSTSDNNPNRTFTRSLTKNYLWHAASGSRHIPGYGFSEADAYPDARIRHRFNPIPEPFLFADSLSGLSGTWISLKPAIGQIGPVSLSISHEHENMGVGLLGYRKDGGVSEWILPMENSLRTEASSPFYTFEMDSLLVAVVNTHRSEPLSYEIELSIASVPEFVTLEPNYPNPFPGPSGQPLTTIPFSIPESMYVTLTVYDVTGKKVAVLFDRDTDPGWYPVPFNAQGLASGVYVYELRAGNKRKFGKFTYIR